MLRTNTLTENKEVLDLESKPLMHLIIRASDIALKSHDYNITQARSANLRFNDDAGLTFISDESSEIKELPVSRYALGQLSTKIGVPVSYVSKCLSSGRIELAKDNINSWLEDFNKDLLIREYDGKVRGVLSNKYSVCDSHEILKAVDEAVDLKQYDIKGSFLNEERLHVRFINKSRLHISGEDLFTGLFLDSSDVGRNVLTVRFGIYKQVCTNGLVISRAGGTLFEQKHIGITSEEFFEGLVKSLKNVDLLTQHAEEWVKYAKQMRNHFSIKDEDDIQKFIEYIRKQTNLSERSAHKVIDLMSTKYDNSKWGLINGITEVAQDYTLERRLELERMAGLLLVA